MVVKKRHGIKPKIQSKELLEQRGTTRKMAQNSSKQQEKAEKISKSPEKKIHPKTHTQEEESKKSRIKREGKNYFQEERRQYSE